MELAKDGDVLVVTKQSLAESNTHYAQGGIAVAAEGEADIALHLLDTVNAGDGIVFRPAAQAMLDDGLPLVPSTAPETATTLLSDDEEAEVENVIARLQASMWAHAGLLREETSLREGVAVQRACTGELAELAKGGKGSRRLSEAQALSRVAEAVLLSALAQTESRGAHYRNDFPQRDDQGLRKHSVISQEDTIRFEEW